MAIRLDNAFLLDMTPDQAWALLNDVERIAPCVPGAQLTDVDGDTYGGKVKVKLGPITAEYKGKATITARDPVLRQLTLTGKGQDVRGQGTAGADLVMAVTDEAGQARVTLGTDLQITGKIAQLGRGVMQDVSSRLVEHFVENLKALPKDDLSPAPAEATPDPVAPTSPDPSLIAATSAAPPTPAPTAPAASGPRAIHAPEAAPVDLVKLGGSSQSMKEMLVGGWMVLVTALLVLILLK